MKLPFLLLTCCLAVYSPAATQVPGSVRWEASARSGAVKNTITVTLRGVVDNGWHVCAETQAAGGPTPLAVRLDEDSPYKLTGAFTGTSPIRHHDTSFGFDTEYYTGTFVLRAPAKAVTHNAGDVTLAVRFQVCSETTCMPPHTVHLVAKTAGA